MHLEETAVAGAFVVRAAPHRDARGFFARLSCTETFARAGIEFQPTQTSLSRNTNALTLRGMHYCLEPEQKLVHCMRGRIFDVAVDLRPDSRTFRRWVGIELDETSATGLFIPAGVAHGFLSLEPESGVLYEIDRPYRPGRDAGVRWNDPAFAFAWPKHPLVMNERDGNYEDFRTGECFSAGATHSNGEPKA